MKYLMVALLASVIILATYHDVGMIKVPALDTASEVIRGK